MSDQPDLNAQRRWTVAELIQHLETMPQDAKVTLIDADTNWLIDLFSVTECLDDGEVTFFPCDYGDMIR